MTYKRFEYVAFDGFTDNGEFITPYQVVKLLNELHEENERLNGEIQGFIKGIQETAKVSADGIMKTYRGDYE